ncbi:MAG: hypothetical protein RBR43_10425 [Desulfuromonadaceae bacterium]|nr:hypothetical protein [Desulfuromonadaceae bacterium]
MQVEKGYEKLVAVFQAAHDQAAHGKGKERHANGLPFHKQRMQSISKLLDSPDGMAYQVVKKMTEGLQFEDRQQREKELLGAINYLAGIVIFFREAGEGSIVPAEGNWPESAEARSLQIMQNGNDGAPYGDFVSGAHAMYTGDECAEFTGGLRYLIDKVATLEMISSGVVTQQVGDVFIFDESDQLTRFSAEDARKLFYTAPISDNG